MSDFQLLFCDWCREAKFVSTDQTQAWEDKHADCEENP